MIFTIKPSEVIPLIDLTSLPPKENIENVRSLCENARTDFGNVASVCVWPDFVRAAKRELKNSPVRVTTVLNFPSGEKSATEVLQELNQALEDGADELDIVFPYRDYLAGDKEKALHLIELCRKEAPKKVMKVIMETGEMRRALPIMEAGRALIDLGVQFLKTSTGKTQVGATLPAVNALLEVIREKRADVGIKISGGVKTLEQVSEYVELSKSVMGDDWLTPDHFRIGASSLLQNIISMQEG